MSEIIKRVTKSTKLWDHTCNSALSNFTTIF